GGGGGAGGGAVAADERTCAPYRARLTALPARGPRADTWRCTMDEDGGSHVIRVGGADDGAVVRVRRVGRKQGAQPRCPAGVRRLAAAAAAAARPPGGTGGRAGHRGRVGAGARHRLVGGRRRGRLAGGP